MKRRALVIGATGGIGAGFARRFAAKGMEVVGISRQDGLNLLQPRSVDEVMSSLEGPFHRIIVATGILAPAGQRPEKSLAEINADSMARLFAVNAIGPAIILRHFPRLLARDESSASALLTARVGSIGDNWLGGWYSYRASKAAANQIVRTAAIELRRRFPLAVLVALHPGTVDTPFTASYAGRQKLAPDEAAGKLAKVLDALMPEQSGEFFDHAGRPIPW